MPPIDSFLGVTMSIKSVRSQSQASVIPDLAHPTLRQAFRKSDAAAVALPQATSDFSSGSTGKGPSLTATSAAPAAVASGNVGWSDGSVQQNSAVRFDATNPDVQAFAQAQGWNQPGQRVAVVKADLVYTTDGWKTTKTAPLQYLYNNYQGFILRDVPKGAQIEYAIHAEVGVSHDGFYSLDQRADTWFNNGGQNYRGTTGDVTGN